MDLKIKKFFSHHCPVCHIPFSKSRHLSYALSTQRHTAIVLLLRFFFRSPISYSTYLALFLTCPSLSLLQICPRWSSSSARIWTRKTSRKEMTCTLNVKWMQILLHTKWCGSIMWVSFWDFFFVGISRFFSGLLDFYVTIFAEIGLPQNVPDDQPDRQTGRDKSSLRIFMMVTKRDILWN